MRREDETVLMIVEAARQLFGFNSIIVGSGLPLAAAAVAQKLRPNQLNCIFDSGIIGADLGDAPSSVSSAKVLPGGSYPTGSEVLSCLLPRGRISGGILGAAQLDSHGRINSSYITNKDRSVLRLPGAGGATSIARYVGKLVIIMKTGYNKFPVNCDYVSSAPFEPLHGSSIDGCQRCEELVVVTNRCVMLATRSKPKLKVLKLMPSYSFDDVAHDVNWIDRDHSDLSFVSGPDQYEREAIQHILSSSSWKQKIYGYRGMEQ